MDIVKELNIVPTKIWRNFKTLADFKQTTARGRRCLEKCHGCKLFWQNTKSAGVHMAIGLDGKTNYICDTCLDSIGTLSMNNQDGKEKEE